jgi:hypothetical protein
MRARATGGHQVAARLLLGSATALMMVVLVNPAAAKPQDNHSDLTGRVAGYGLYKEYDLHGAIAAGGTVSFQALVKRLNRKAGWVPKKVTNLAFAGVPVTCDDGPHTIDVSRDGVRVRVKHRNFSYQFPSVTASVEGKLRKHGERATGQFSYGPSDPPGLTNCSSDGPLSWSAELHNTTPCSRLWRSCF